MFRDEVTKNLSKKSQTVNPNQPGFFGTDHRPTEVEAWTSEEDLEKKFLSLDTWHLGMPKTPSFDGGEG